MMGVRTRIRILSGDIFIGGTINKISVSYRAPIKNGGASWYQYQQSILTIPARAKAVGEICSIEPMVFGSGKQTLPHYALARSELGNKYANISLIFFFLPPNLLQSQKAREPSRCSHVFWVESPMRSMASVSGGANRKYPHQEIWPLFSMSLVSRRTYYVPLGWR